MHIPDGFLDVKTAVAGAALAAAGLGLSLREVRRQVPPARIPLIGLGAAFVFAAQMLNFPVLAGASGHLVGATLSAILLGPSAAVLVMSAVLILQCLLFADGGLTALGANLFNMALVAPWSGYALYRLLRRVCGNSLRGRLMAASFAAWASTVCAAVCCAGQLALSGTVAWGTALPVLALVHIAIGLGEGLITALVLAGIARTRPELFPPTETARPTETSTSVLQTIGFGLLLSLGLAAFVAPFACSWPDGLEWAAERLGFARAAADKPIFHSPMPDYQWPGVATNGWGTAITGMAGALAAFLIAWVTARWLAPASNDSQTTVPPAVSKQDERKSDNDN
jgi:cobalt/nickel transport system permease protein